MSGQFLKFAALAAASMALTANGPPAQVDRSCTANCAAVPRLSEGSASFAFTGWDGPALTVWAHVPSAVDPATAPIAFIMHGARRNPDNYRDAWVEEAEQGGFIVIAPGFPRIDFPGARNYNMGGLFDEAGEPRPHNMWSFSAIEPLFDEVVARLGSNQTQYTIYGHSAGSQFVHRFLFFMPEARAKRFMVANAGWYTFPDPDIAFPFGLDGTPVSEDRLRAILTKDVVILLGDRDTDRRHSSLNRSKGAMRQGPHRFARGKKFYQSAREFAEDKGWPFGWSLRVVEGVAHSNSGMAEGSWDLIE